MSDLPRIVLKKGRDASLRRYHPWLFSGAIERREGELGEGAPVEVYSHEGEFLGCGHFGEGDIAVKILSFRKTVFDAAFWRSAIARALSVREQLGLSSGAGTDAFRLVNAEGDSLPGLVVDLYGDTAVVQAHTLGMYLARDALIAALKECLGDRLACVFDRSSDSLILPRGESPARGHEVLYGGLDPEKIIEENGLRFETRLSEGQKTGFYLDQRDNRQLLRSLCASRKVLNAFCYTGGFTLYALAGGAASVDSLDSSAPAIETLERNVARLGAGGAHRSIVADAFDHLAQSADVYDVVILDPPPFARHRGALAGALKGYRAVNYHGVKRLARGGLLLTFSCSQVVSRDDFTSCVERALTQAGRRGHVLRRLSAAACHAVSLHHPEGEYLKGYLLRID